MCTCKVQMNGSCQLNACLVLCWWLVKPQLAEPRQLRLGCICLLLADVTWWRRVICLIPHLSLEVYRQARSLVMELAPVCPFTCWSFILHWIFGALVKRDGLFISQVTQVTHRLVERIQGVNKQPRGEQRAKTSCGVTELMPLSDLQVGGGSKGVLCREMRGSQDCAFVSSLVLRDTAVHKPRPVTALEHLQAEGYTRMCYSVLGV